MKPRPATCAGCPANEWGIGWVEPEGPPDAQFAFVGQGPGQEEAQWAHPFHEAAPSGFRLTKWMRKAGLSRTRVLVGNTVQCWLPERLGARGEPIGNRDPTRAEQVACWNRYVGPWLRGWASHPGRHLVALGGSATKFLMGLTNDGGFEKWAGTTMHLALPPHPLPEETTSEAK